MNNAVIIFILLIFFSGTLTGQTFFDRFTYDAKIMSLINSPGSDISPALVKGQLFFTSASEDVVMQNTGVAGFYNVYYTKIDINGFPQMLRRPVPGLGNSWHEGPVAWCEATGELFVTVSNLAPRDSKGRRIKAEEVRLKLIIMKEIDEVWSVVEELPFNKPEYHFAHPAISRSGDTLIFSSDMEGGFGNSDLYKSIRKNGVWGEPVNLGKEINTPGNELFPTLGPDNLLMFSSNGHPDNFGELDIYYTSLSGGTPVNPGNNINSEYDEFGLIIHPSLEYGYFSSNRPNVGDDDLYRVQFTPLYETIGGTVADSNGEPVPGATVHLLDCNENILQSAESAANGQFRFEVLRNQCYQAMASKDGFSPDSKPFQLYKNIRLNIVEHIKYNIITLDSETGEGISGVSIFCDNSQWISDENGIAVIDADSLNSCALRISGEGFFDFIIPEDPNRFFPGVDVTDTIRLFKKEHEKIFQLNNIFFFLDKWRLLPESEHELRNLIKLMNDNPALKIELASHTDSRGEAQYNKWLSQKRSDSARDFLVENGIEMERIESKGYGESMLLNHCTNNVPCSEEEHLENQRTEFIVREF